MDIWNIDPWPKQKSLPQQSHVISLYFQIKYLICLIVLYCHRRSLPPLYPLSNLDGNNLPFTIGDIVKGEFNWNMHEIIPPCYEINICILCRLYFKQYEFLKEEISGYTHANFHRAMTFSCRNIAFQILWYLCEPHRREWSKTFLVEYVELKCKPICLCRCVNLLFNILLYPTLCMRRVV